MEMAAVHRVPSLNAVTLGQNAASTVYSVSIKAVLVVVLAVLVIHLRRIAAKT
jgi:hypothetical protein